MGRSRCVDDGGGVLGEHRSDPRRLGMFVRRRFGSIGIRTKTKVVILALLQIFKISRAFRIYVSSPPKLGGVPKGRGGSTGCPVVRLCDPSLDAGYAYRKALLPG